MTYVVPAKHFFWMPAGIQHDLRIGNQSTIFRSLFFYTWDDAKAPFYSKMGIYPADELLIQMIHYSERWDEQHVRKSDENFEFLIALKNILPRFDNMSLPIILHTSDNERIKEITRYIEGNYGENLSLPEISKKFNFSERSFSRFFKEHLQMSFLQYVKTFIVIKSIELLLKTERR